MEQARHGTLLVHGASALRHDLQCCAQLRWRLQQGCKITCMATAVEESASPPPSTIEAGPLQPVTAITVYATTASVATTFVHERGRQSNFGNHRDAPCNRSGCCQITGT